MKLKNLFFAALAVVSLSALYSCDEEDDKFNVEIDYEYSCSRDLLEFVTPVMTYTDAAGTHELEMAGTAWTDSSDNYMYFEKTVNYDHFGIDNTCSVRYELNENALENVDLDREYRFYSHLNIPAAVALAIYDDDRVYNNIYVSVDLKSQDNIVTGDEVRQYVEALITTTEVEHIVVDGEGNITVTE